MRREIERRPFVVFLIALVIGLTAVGHPVNLAFLVTALVLLFSLKNWTILAVGLLIGLLLAPQPVDLLKSTSYFMGTAKVVGVPIELNGTELADALVGVQKVRLELPAPQVMHYGETWNVSGLLHPLSEISQVSVQDGGVQGTFQVLKAVRVKQGPWLFALADGWRSHFQQLTHRVLDPDDAEWIDMICFRNGNLSSRDRTELQEAGQSYLVSASGLHVYVLVGLIFGVLSLVRAPRPFAIACCLAILVLYTFATGMHLSTVRAAVACILFLSAYLFRREPDTLSALGFAGVAFLILFPTSVYGLGFQVSMLVIAAMALFMPRFKAQEPTARGALLRSARGAAWAAGIVLLAGQPIMALYTGEASLSAIPSNLLTAIVAPVVLGLCFLADAVDGLCHPLAVGFLTIATPLVEFIRVIAHWASGANLRTPIPAFSSYWLVPYYGLWLAVWRPRAVPD